MRVAAYQADLGTDAGDMLARISDQVRRCEDEQVDVLCCPEAVLGGLADYAIDATQSAIPTAGLDAVLAPLASERVTTVIGFTELAAGGALFNSAAVLHRGSVVGVYRKLHPAINRSVYTAGRELPLFRIPGLAFSIVICNDSNFPELAQRAAAMGARVLLIPTNNALPPDRIDPAAIAAQALAVDVDLATRNRLWIVRADVSGARDGLESAGASGIVDPHGAVFRSGQGLGEGLLSAVLVS